MGLFGNAVSGVCSVIAAGIMPGGNVVGVGSDEAISTAVKLLFYPLSHTRYHMLQEHVRCSGRCPTC